MSKQVDQFGLPLAEERTRYEDEDAGRALGEESRDHEARFDGFAESDFVREDATALRDAAQGEHHGVDLVGVRVYAAPAETWRRRSPARRWRTRSSA